MVKLAIKIDWMNMRVEFSPNQEIVDKNTESDKSIILINTKNTYSDEEYPVFVLSKNDIEMEEPFDSDDKFWSGFIEPSGSESSITSGSAVPTYEAPVAPTYEAPAAPTYEAPAAPTTFSGNANLERAKIEAQMESIQKMVSDLDAQFQAGQIQQDLFIKKKEYLAQKLGSLMGQLELL